MDNIFQFTMSGLTAGLRVVHIAALQLMTCELNQDIKQVLENPELNGFDHIPILNRKRIVGILERERTMDLGTVKENMRALDDSLLVSADEPLTSFVSCLKTSPYRLVVKGTEIKGIVTRSDLIKLPVPLQKLRNVSWLRSQCPCSRSHYDPVKYRTALGVHSPLWISCKSCCRNKFSPASGFRDCKALACAPLDLRFVGHDCVIGKNRGTF